MDPASRQDRIPSLRPLPLPRGGLFSCRVNNRIPPRCRGTKGARSAPPPQPLRGLGVRNPPKERERGAGQQEALRVPYPDFAQARVRLMSIFMKSGLSSAMDLRPE